jgi:hypothetical protein
MPENVTNLESLVSMLSFSGKFFRTDEISLRQVKCLMSGR